VNRLSVQHLIIIGLLFWGLSATVVAGTPALLYTVAAVIPVWLFSLRSPSMVKTAYSSGKLGSTAIVILATCAVAYFVGDAFFGQKLLSGNLFLHGNTAVEASVENSLQGESQGRGIVALLGTILSLLPFCLIDVSARASRFGRWALWIAAMLLLFYGVGASRGAVIIAILTIVMGRTSSWKRMIVAAGFAFAVFTLASSLRGDFGNTRNPLADAFGAPFINLMMMRHAHCGTAPWYSYVGEFFKKFIPGFVYPKSVYSFNLETSLCIYPSADNRVEAISIFTWLGEIFYYTPSILTAISAGTLLGAMGRIVNRQLVKNQLPCARLAIGFACIITLRSRSQDVLSSLIAYLLFLLLWPHLCRLSIYLRHCVAPNAAQNYAEQPHGELQ
jgi:hypothetical protein